MSTALLGYVGEMKESDLMFLIKTSFLMSSIQILNFVEKFQIRGRGEKKLVKIT